MKVVVLYVLHTWMAFVDRSLKSVYIYITVFFVICPCTFSLVCLVLQFSF